MHYRNDYITHPLSKHEPPPKAFYVPPSTSMQGASTYTQDYLSSHKLHEALRRSMGLLEQIIHILSFNYSYCLAFS